MHFSESIIAEITGACSSAPVDSSHQGLLHKLKEICPDLAFSHVLTRQGWYRTGGLFNSHGERVSPNLREWLETKTDGDMAALFDKYADAGLQVSSQVGKTHYFVVQTGESAQDFVQLEVEELQEVMDHVLFANESLPDDIEDIIDPVDIERISATPVDRPHYIFRRVTYIADYIQDFLLRQGERGNKIPPIKRFMQDWERGSSYESGYFCHHWVLTLHDYKDAYGERIIQIKPVSTFVGAVPDMTPDGSQRGIELSNVIQGFDKVVGYPMAWYFFMLTHRGIPYALAEHMHKDLMGEYDYLPTRDWKILKDWSKQPYSV